MPLVLASGFATGLSLIVAIGAQNAFVLRQGLVRDRVPLVVTVCVASDAVLISAGTAGVGALVTRAPGLLTGIQLVGAAFLLCYAIAAARRAVRGGHLDAAGGGGAAGWAPVLLTTLALTWLNPHVYLDTVLLLGSMAATHGGGRWWFATGAVVASALWFSGLGFGARLLAPLFRRRRAWQVLDGLIAVVMTVLAVGLLLRG